MRETNQILRRWLCVYVCVLVWGEGGEGGEGKWVQNYSRVKSTLFILMNGVHDKLRGSIQIYITTKIVFKNFQNMECFYQTLRDFIAFAKLPVLILERYLHRIMGLLS